jgi:hypothetical protein
MIQLNDEPQKNDLLAVIFTDEKTNHIDTIKFHSAVARAATYGSPEIKRLLNPIMFANHRNGNAYRDSFPSMESVILDELKETRNDPSITSQY